MQPGHVYQARDRPRLTAPMSIRDRTDEDTELARIWDEDEQARDIAEEAFASLLDYVDVRASSWPRRRVLDVGCGTGLLTEKIAPFVKEVVAVDTSPGMLAVLADKGLPNVELRCADIDHAVVPWSGRFDLIVASCLCATLPDYRSTLHRLAMAMGPGGLFAQWDWLRDDSEDDEGLTLDEVSTAFWGAGLSAVHIGHGFEALVDDGSLLVGIGMGSVVG